MSEKRTIEVTAAVVHCDAGYMICRRSNGLWEFPGGKLEMGETPDECLIRECREELSIRIQPGRLLDRIRVSVSDDRELELLFFETEILEGVPRASVHSEIRFVPESAFPDYEFCEADRIFLERHFEEMRKPI